MSHRPHRPRLGADGLPTRDDVTLMTEVEKHMRAALKTLVETETNDTSMALRDAISLYTRALSLVAGHMEGEEYPRPARRGAPGALDMVLKPHV